MSWQPISTAPKDGTFVLIYEGDTSKKMWRAHWIEDAGWMFGVVSDDRVACVFFRCQPTHWMPLPEPPEGE